MGGSWAEKGSRQILQASSNASSTAAPEEEPSAAADMMGLSHDEKEVEEEVQIAMWEEKKKGTLEKVFGVK